MSNDLAVAVPTILKYGLLALRQYSVMPRLVNTDYANEVKEKGDTIDVIIPSAVATADVVPGTVPAGTAVKPSKAPIKLENWKEAAFRMTDKELREIDDKQMLVGQSSEALKGLCNAVDLSLIVAATKGFYSSVGTSGVTPSTTADIINIRKKLNKQLAPKGNRAYVIDGDAEGNFLNLALFTSKADSDRDTLISGELGERFGLTVVHDQNIEGNAFTSGAQDGNYQVNGVNAAGATSLVIKTGANDIHEGDQFTIAGFSQEHVCTELYAGGAGTMKIWPPLPQATAGNELLTFKGNAAQVNLGFHRDAISLAVRPLITPDGFGVISASDVDPISSLVLRLEVERVHKQTIWSWDILWGIGCTRPEYGSRGLG